jgi:uncharacterized protein YjiS (DUF1127 family)
VSGRLITSYFGPSTADQRAPVWKDVLRLIRVIVSRRELLDREPRLLADIGLTRAEAFTEASRAPWDTQPPPRGPRNSGENRRTAAFLRSFGKAYRRHRSRRRIAQLDGRMLKDIDVTFAEAEEEANKPFWRD